MLKPMLFRMSKAVPPLSDYVDWFWFYEGLYPPHRYERVLPDGSMEPIVNLREEPRHVFDPTNLRSSALTPTRLAETTVEYPNFVPICD